MSASQFTIYSSSDASAPQLTGNAGTLLALLDAVLVNGYGTQPAAGWSKPFVNSSSIGCYRNSISGSGLSMSINDNGPGAGSFKEARISGFEVLTSVSTGTGQFPSLALAQGVAGGGFNVIRKSATLSDTIARPWIVVADAYTMYMFVLTGDTAANYVTWAFGDIFSLKGNTDAYRCFISGRTGENSVAANQDSLGVLGALTSSSGNFMARTLGGGAFSIAISKHGDTVKGGTSLAGVLATPCPADGGVYLAPVWVAESVTSFLRGRLRGFYQILHPISYFTDGQSFSGTGDFASKAFRVIKQGTDGAGNTIMYVVETSATVETN